MAYRCSFLTLELPMLTSVHGEQPLHSYPVHGEQPLHSYTSPFSSLTSDELHLTPPHHPSHLVHCGISMVGGFILQLRDTMSLIKADLGSACVSEHGNQRVCLHPTQQNQPVSPLHEPLHWRAKRNPKACMRSLQSFLREESVVGLCWAD